jgi:hypothetical protein
VIDFAAQWLHFLHSEVVPQFIDTDREFGRVQRIVFSGEIAHRNWDAFASMVCPAGLLAPYAPAPSPSAGTGVEIEIETEEPVACAQVRVQCTRALEHAALVGAAKYALGSGARSMGIWRDT